MMFQPRQVIRIGFQWYEVEGNFLGAERQTSLVGLWPLTLAPGVAHGKEVREMFVPEHILALAVGADGEVHAPGSPEAEHRLHLAWEQGTHRTKPRPHGPAGYNTGLF